MSYRHLKAGSDPEVGSLPPQKQVKRGVIHSWEDMKMGKDLRDLLEALDILWKDFNNCRAYFPYVQEDAVGATTAQTAPYYIAQGFNISFVFNEGLSMESILKINQIGHWINQNFVIRLCALLESYYILEFHKNFKKIDYLDKCMIISG